MICLEGTHLVHTENWGPRLYGVFYAELSCKPVSDLTNLENY